MSLKNKQNFSQIIKFNRYIMTKILIGEWIMKKKLIVISADALSADDMGYLSTLPNYQRYLAGGCRIEKVTSVYPTITYPCHTTMITGVYPDKHKIPGNFELHPGCTTDLPWLWDYKWNNWPEDIFKSAKRAGYHTASVFWPVTGNHPAIDDLIAEYWIQDPDDTPRKAYTRMGSDERMINIIEKYMRGKKQLFHPELDEFIVDCACEVIRQYRPDILFAHPANIDAARHKYGVFNDQVTEAVKRTDDYIGRIMKAVEESGDLEDTNLVLTSDHGQMDIRRMVHLNVLLADKGFIKVNDQGIMESWDAWCLSGGMSGLVYLKKPKDKKIWTEVYEFLKELCKEGIYGISQIFTREEVREFHHLDGDFSFVLETDGFTSFGDSYKRPIVTNFINEDYRYGQATHGYLPNKGIQPVFIAKGPGFQENVVLQEGRLIDEAPTLAKLLGVSLEGSDGRPLNELLK